MPRPPADDPLAAEALLAELSLGLLRARMWWHVRWACFASVVLWARALVHGVPGLVAWFAVLAQGGTMAMAATYGALLAHWARRAAALHPAPQAAEATRGGEWDDLRSALWLGLAAVALVPWTYEVLGRAWPPVLLAALAGFAASLFVLVLLLETAADLIGCVVRHRGRAGPAALRPPPGA